MTHGAQAEIANMVQRTFHIRHSFASGTAFAIEQDDHQYLVTAKHVIVTSQDSIRQGETIRLYSDEGQLMVFPVVRMAACDGDPDSGGIDVAVLELSDKIPFGGRSPGTGLPEDLHVAQNIIMPTAEFSTAFGSAFGIGVRTGSVTKLILRPETRGPYSGDFLVAMEAYPGFSGSPLLSWNEEGKVVLVGMTARFSWRNIPAFNNAPVHTGVIGCFHIAYALEVIRAMRAEVGIT